MFVLRVSATGFLLLCAVLSIRLLTLYKGSLLEEPWLPVFLGVVFLASSQTLAAAGEESAFFNVDAILILRSGLLLAGVLFLFLGLYRTLKIWRRLSRMAAVVLSVQDKQEEVRNASINCNGSCFGVSGPVPAGILT
jgi:hypothetical protein